MTHTPDFLKSSGLQGKIKKSRWPQILVAIFAFVILVGLVLVRPIQGFIKSWGYVSQGRVALTKAEELGGKLDFAGADSALGEALFYFGQAEKEMDKTKILNHVPWIGVQARSIQGVLGASLHTIAALREVLGFGSDLSQVIYDAESASSGILPIISPQDTLSSLSREQKRMILARFLADVPILESARDRIDSAMEAFRTIPTQGVSQSIVRAIEPLTTRLPRLRNDIYSAIPLAKILPAFAGYPEPKDTLVLFLNNAELRPGGGFIGTVGHLNIADATILSLDTKDSYAIDRPAEAFLNIAPPLPLQNYFGLSRWFMRDSNWSPDFRASSQNIIDFYERETSRGNLTGEIDNIIGFTPTFASEILRITGPVTVSGETFNADNLFEVLEYEVERGFVEENIPHSERKVILSHLVEATVSKLFSLPASRLEEVIAVLDKGFREKQLMIYDKNLDTQKIIEQAGWGGGFETNDGDFFAVIDANLGSLKSDPSVKRKINYHIEPDGDAYKATVSITYRHEGHFDWKTTRYRTYTRVYVPEGSEFISASGSLKDDKLKNPKLEPGPIDVGVAEDLAALGIRAKYFGAFISIEPGEERTLSFTYRVSDSVAQKINNNSCYKLKAQKQLGAFSHELTLDIDFGKTLKSANPPEDARDFGDKSYNLHTNLAEDREFEVCF